MTTDEKRDNVARIYNVLIGNLISSLDAMNQRPEEVKVMPRNRHTMATLDELIGHLQERREKQIGKVK